MNLGLRIWIPGAALATILALTGGWFIGVQPQLAAAAASDATTSTVEAANAATHVRLVQLSKLAAKSDEMRADEVVLQKAVPAILKPNTFVRRVNEVAALDGVGVTAVTPGSATAYTAAPSLTGSSSEGTIALGRVKPSITAANFTVVPVSVTVTGSDSAVWQFADDIQNDQRLFAITSVSTALNEGVVTATFGGSIYTLKR